MQPSEDLGQWMPKFRFELVVSEQEQSDEGDPDLSEHGMSAGSKEGLDLEVLFDPFKEKLHLPTLPVQVGDRLCVQMESVGEEKIMMPGFGIPIADPAKRDRAIPGLDAGEDDRLIAGKPFCFVHRPAIRHPVTNSLLHAGDEEDAVLAQLPEEGKIDVTPIHQNHGEGGQGEQSCGCGDVADNCLGDLDEGRDVSVVVE